MQVSAALEDDLDSVIANLEKARKGQGDLRGSDSICKPEIVGIAWNFNAMTSNELKLRLRELGDATPEEFRIRLHRAISWLARAELEAGDDDARFLFLWIAFNAAYAREFGFDDTERNQARQFFQQLVELDAGGRLHALLHERFTGDVRLLIENRFVFEPFWKALREHDASDRWSTSFNGSKKAALASVLRKDTLTLLGIVFDRLFVLRNQLVHGGSTHGSKVNREQVLSAAGLMGALVPAVLEAMLQNPEVDFGHIAYPVLPTG